MPLTIVDPGAIPDTLNVLLYGPSGSGKSTAAFRSPGPVLYVNADGPDALKFLRRKYGSTQISEVTASGPSLNEVLLTLRGEHPFRTVVLDTISAIYTVLLEERSKGGRPTLPQHGDVGVAIERFCRELRDLPVNGVLLCEEYGVKDESSGVIERLPYTGTNNPALGGKLIEMAGVVGYCGRVTPQDGNPLPRYMATLVDAPGRRGKDRTDALGVARDLDLTDWIQTAAAPQPAELQEAA